MPLTPEILVPRLGDALVEAGLLTPIQLEQALLRQKSARETGDSSPIGQILVEMGFITRSTLDQAVTNQIQKLQSALQQSNESLEHRVAERTAELNLAYQKLTELSKLKANFVSNISHELRTPLTHIKGYVDLLISESFGPIDEQMKSALEVTERSIDRLGRLIDDLILFSTAEVNTIQIDKRRTDLIPIARKVIACNTHTAKQKQITLSIECTAEALEVIADSGRIHWVINQLVENAIKYTGVNGSVSLSLFEENDKVIIKVTDTGMGIQKERIEEIFEPFHQLDSAADRKQGGTGIGLTLAKKIVEAHGSKIDVISKPGEGSKFYFNLPLILEKD